MSNAKGRIVAAVAGVLLLGAAGARAVDATPEQQAQLQALESKIAGLESQQAAASKDMAATVDAILRDAEKRSQLLAAGGDMSAGYDNGFFIKSGSSFSLKPAMQFQFRNITNFRDSTGNGSDLENGFEVRRMRLDMGGNIISKDLEYFFQWESARNGGDLTLLEAWGKYMFSDDWGFRAGQFKDPVTHEFVMSTKRQLAVETSLMDNLIGGGTADYTQGVLVIYNGESNNKNPISAEFGLTDGAGQRDTDFEDRLNYNPITGRPGAYTPNFGVVGRVEYKAFGDWKNYKDFTAKGVKEDLLVLGAAGDWTQAGDGNLILGTVDAQWKNTTGWSVYGAFVARYLDGEARTTDAASDAGLFEPSSTDYGAMGQVAYMINGNWELFGRYSITLLDEASPLRRDGVLTGQDEDNFQEITVGVNYYMGDNGSAGHRAKFTIDLSWLPEGAPRAITGAGILDNNGGDNEFMLRAQFQLLI